MNILKWDTRPLLIRVILKDDHNTGVAFSGFPLYQGLDVFSYAILKHP